MHIDGLTVAALVAELGATIAGSRVQQIYHPQASTITLELWAREEKILLIETGELPRVHLTAQKLAHPAHPSAFCMLLRKYLRNGVIVGVGQPGLERIIDLRIRHGEEYLLRAELLGRHANIVLLQGERVLGALKSIVGQRSFRPGETYQAPPPQGKLDPRAMTQEEFFARLGLEEMAGLQIAQALLHSIDGIGPRFAQEIAVRAGLDPAQPVSLLTEERRLALWSATRQLCESVQEKPSPSLYFDGDKLIDIAPIPLQLYAGLRRESRPTLSEAFDAFVRLAPEPGGFAYAQRRLHEIVRGHCDRVRKALERVTKDLQGARDYERLRREGELLLAHLSELRKGMSEVELEGFDGTKTVIKLDPALDPVANAQQKFERYKKLKRAQEKLAARLDELRNELEYLEGVASSIEQAEGEADLAQISEELEAGGYLPREPQSREPSPAVGPREFVIRGYRVWVGRSSKQNDELIRRAAREDYWLHARDRPGSHVIIRNPQQREIPSEVLHQAAQLAAYYSKGRGAKKVPVSYTRVKYLRKGGRPGLVFVTHEEGTLVVAPKGEP